MSQGRECAAPAPAKTRRRDGDGTCLSERRGLDGEVLSMGHSSSQSEDDSGCSEHCVGVAGKRGSGDERAAVLDGGSEGKRVSTARETTRERREDRETPTRKSAGWFFYGETRDGPCPVRVRVRGCLPLPSGPTTCYHS